MALVTALGQDPTASLPRACGSWAALKSTYHVLHNPVVMRTALSGSHWQHTRQAAAPPGVTLFISDLTELDDTHDQAMTGLGEIGDGNQRGFHVQTTLAYRPAVDQMLGVAAQQTMRRQRSPLTRAQRRTRQEVESQVWGDAVAQIGRPPPGAQWGHVGDRAADI